MFYHFSKDESGGTALEYGLLATIVSITAIIVMKSMGSQLSETFYYIGSELTR